MKSKSSKFLTRVASLALVGGFSACSTLQPEPEVVVLRPEPAYVGVERGTPPGVDKMCWQEPQVAYEANGPGVDAEGKWYHPAYNAVRQVKGGRWIPCAELSK